MYRFRENTQVGHESRAPLIYWYQKYIPLVLAAVTSIIDAFDLDSSLVPLLTLAKS